MVYNFKGENIQEYKFGDYLELSNDIVQEFVNLRRFENISIFSNYIMILNIIVHMFPKDFDVIISKLHQNKSYHLYDKVILTITDNCQISVEEMYYQDNTKCKNPESALIYADMNICTENDILNLASKNESILLFDTEGVVN